MRLFVAADISSETLEAMRRSRAVIDSVVAQTRVPPRVTWVGDAVAHITLRFIGEVTDAAAGEVVAALAPPLAMAPFDVEWATLGVFPPGRSGLRHPRTIVLGAAAGADALVALAAAVNDRLTPVVGAGDDRPHTPHVTVGRVKFPGKGVVWADVLEAARPPVTVSRISHVTLYRSELSSRGPTYTAICTTEFDVRSARLKN